MKKLWIIPIIAVLIAGTVVALSACKPGHTPDTDEPSGPTQSDSTVGSFLNGAVYTVPLSANTNAQVYKLGKNLLLLQEDGGMTLLSGKTYETLATGQIPGGTGEDSCFSITEKGVSCFDAATNEVICLNDQLLETRRVKLPEGISGKPALYAGGQEVFYCLGDEIRAMNIHTGVARLVKKYICHSLELTGVYFDGSMLVCQVYNEADTGKLQGAAYYLSAEDGTSLGQHDHIFYLLTYGDRYFLSRMDGVIHQFVFGNRTAEDPWQLHSLGLGNEKIISVLELYSVINYNPGEILRLYDLNTGKIKAEIALEGLGEIFGFRGDPGRNCAWFLSRGEQGEQMLCRWDLEKTPASGSEIRIGKLYTAHDPDTEGLEACEKKADALNSRFGVRINIWQEGIKAPGTYTLVPEYQTAAIDPMLDRVEKVLERLPEGIVQNLVADGDLRICIVRSISDGHTAVQYWQGGEPYIALSVSADVEEVLLRELFRVMDVYVIGNSRLYDDWAQLNPPDFSYGMEDGKYLEQGNMAFVDGISMKTPVEDRIRILVGAMQPDNGDLFQNPILQSKYQRICDAIREAYDLEKYQQVLPWEQYLADSNP